MGHLVGGLISLGWAAFVVAFPGLGQKLLSQSNGRLSQLKPRSSRNAIVGFLALISLLRSQNGRKTSRRQALGVLSITHNFRGPTESQGGCR
jgi:hypothetical protein